MHETARIYRCPRCGGTSLTGSEIMTCTTCGHRDESREFEKYICFECTRNPQAATKVVRHATRPRHGIEHWCSKCELCFDITEFRCSFCKQSLRTMPHGKHKYRIRARKLKESKISSLQIVSLTWKQ